MIQYIKNTNLAIYNGHKFRKDKRSGYWYSGTLGEFLHRYVYKQECGRIPKGYEIHHIDKNKDNNNISNLQLLTCKKHKKLHGQELTKEQRDRLRKNLNDNARPKAIEWHKSAEGSEWHKKQYEKTKDKLYIEKEHICKECGKKYKSVNATNMFCSPNCRSKNRRKSGVDNEKRICKSCGNEFEINKYYKNETCGRHCAMIMRWKNKK